MHEIILSFPGLGPLSVNATYVRTNKGTYKTSTAVEWMANIFNVIQHPDNQEKFSDFKSEFDPKKHAVSVSLYCVYKKEILYTKKGEISNKTVDCTNWEKALVDCIFLPKFNDAAFPYGAPNLNLDDRIIVKLESWKAEAGTGGPGLRVHIKRLDFLDIPQVEF